MPKIRFGIFLKLFSLQSIVTIVCVLIAIYASINSIRPHIISQSLKNGGEIVKNSANSISRDLGGEEDFVRILSLLPEIQSFADSYDDNSRKKIEELFEQIVVDKKIYDQIRYIDNDGLERVRVDLENNNAVVTLQKDLQNKKSRYYFSEGEKLDKGQVYVSIIDLNREGPKQEIEIPYRPVIRFVAPVFDNLGNKKGMIITNVLGQFILDRYENTNEQSSLVLVDPKGYYLLGETIDKAWGGPNDLNTGFNLSNDYPNFYKEVLSGNTGSFSSKDEIVSYAPIFIAGKESVYWVVLEKTKSNQLLGPILSSVTKSISLIGIAYFIIYILISYIVVKIVIRPLSKLTKIVSEASPKNISVPTNIKTNDEVGQLARAYEDMSMRIENSYKNLEQKVKERTIDLQKFQLAVDNSSESILIADPEANIIYANKAVSSESGFENAAIIGKKIGSKDLWGGSMGEEFYKWLQKTVVVDKKVFRGETINRRKDGSQFTVLSSIYPLLDD